METRTKPETEREFSVRDALRKSLSANTRRAYRNGWRRFTVYCDEAGKKPMAASPADVADFLVRLASEPRSPRATTGKGAPLSMGTIRVALAAINRMYREHHRRSPTGDVKVADVFRGLGRRSYRDRRQVKALSVDEMARILACCDGQAARGRRGIIAVRDAAVMTVGFAAALRRSEICALLFADVEFLVGSGEVSKMFLHIRRSKTDQFGRGQRVTVPEGRLLRPVSRLRRWLARSGIERRPLFQTMRRGGHVQGRACTRRTWHDW
ncbi:MAG: site-specific integrase [bacterium]|nr:site-specific integrase [bacterium]